MENDNPRYIGGKRTKETRRFAGHGSAENPQSHVYADGYQNSP